MEMTYGGALVMPSNYAVMSEDEMTYVEGGKSYTIKMTAKQAAKYYDAMYWSIRGLQAMSVVTCGLVGSLGGVLTAYYAMTVGGGTLIAMLNPYANAYNAAANKCEKMNSNQKIKGVETLNSRLYLSISITKI